jgi:dipeptide/tripeptide permease
MEQPRELFILFITKIIEYAAYGAMNMSFILYLSADCGLGDIAAGSFIGGWSMAVTLTTIFVGAVCDAIGIKKTLLIGTVVLVVSRIIMPVTNNVFIAAIFGFLPLAMGIAIMGPVLSVGIKRFTTSEGAAMVFALFYTLMNVGWALGGYLFDHVRGAYGEHSFMEFPLLASPFPPTRLFLSSASCFPFPICC